MPKSGTIIASAFTLFHKKKVAKCGENCLTKSWRERYTDFTAKGENLLTL